MTLFYLMIAAIVLALLMPLLVDFVLVLNRLASFSPLKNNIAQSNLYAFKKEVGQAFLRGKGSPPDEYALYSALVFLNFSMFFISLVLLSPMRFVLGDHASKFYAIVLASALFLMAALKEKEKVFTNFPSLIGSLIYKLSQASLIISFIVSGLARGPFHPSSGLFILSFIFFLFFLGQIEEMGSMERRSFKRHCFSGARMGLAFLTLTIGMSGGEMFTLPETLILAISLSIGLEVCFSIFSVTWPAYDEDLIAKARKISVLLMIASLVWRLW